MNKVILTQEQADRISYMQEHNQSGIILGLHVTDGWGHPKNKALNELSIDEMARALYIGYEVKPTFKVGEYVVYENEVVKNTMKIIDTEAGDILVEPIYEGFEDYNRVSVNSPSLRHATPKEIAEEKERRWWSARNRGVWELRARDILKQKSGNELAEVKEVHNSGYLIGKWTCYESKEYIKKHYTVVCLAENRLDVKDDE